MLLDDATPITETFVLPMHLVLPTIYDAPTHYWCVICSRAIWTCTWRGRATVFPGSDPHSSVGTVTAINVQSGVEQERL